MKLSELIIELQRIQAEHGELEVLSVGDGDPIKSVMVCDAGWNPPETENVGKLDTLVIFT